MRKPNKLLIIGPLPAPAGGISIHITRLTKLLENDFEIDHVDESYIVKTKYFNLRSYNLFKYIKKIFKSDLVYIHSGTRLLRFVHLITAKILLKKIILTLHAYPFVRSKVLIKIDEFLLAFSNLIIVVSPQILDNISLPVSKCLVRYAFLPPIIELEPDLPGYVSEWIKIRKASGQMIVCSNANRLEIFNNQDLYGLDMCIAVANELAKKNYQLSFVFNVSSLNKFRNEYQKYQELINSLNLKEKFLLINEDLSFVNLINQSDIVVRPTNTDGDALTVREALYLDKSIIASDVVPRPSGTILFESRNMIDFENKLISTLSSKPEGKNSNAVHKREEYQHFYTEIINSVIQN